LDSTLKRLFSKFQRTILLFSSGGYCCNCGAKLNGKFHADHKMPFSKEGKTLIQNGQALCPKCNLIKGNNVMTNHLRPWQSEAISQALKWLVEQKSDRHFLINAAPGSGKTIASCELAKKLFSLGEIDRVIVIAPRREVVKQWASDFRRVTGRYMSKVTNSDDDMSDLDMDICATWAAVQGLLAPFQAVCRSSKTLVICDEHHHAAVTAAWGNDANTAFVDAKYVLILSGTPVRSDGANTVWLAYDDQGAINHPSEGTYTLTYGQAVDLGYCRPVTFHRHDGFFTIDIDGDSVSVSGNQPAHLNNELKRIPALQKALSFYRLACTPQFETDSITPKTEGYQWTMIQWATDKINDIRNRMPNAGGLVIAPSIEIAEYFVNVIEIIDGEKPLIVHSQLADSESKIDAFRNTNRRWLVSVAMVSEGVDIPRLRVLVYLPSATTELSFRQAIGRVVRTNGYDDDTRAYVVMPSWEIFERYARRIEDEMPAHIRSEAKTSQTTKKCPSCSSEISLGAKDCSECGHIFQSLQRATKACISCNSINPISASECQTCGTTFQSKFRITLDEALRAGAIVRGMDLTEDDVQQSEAIAEDFRNQILKSGESSLVKILKLLPEEGYSRLFEIMQKVKK
jgi:superfamily II DNA or RNA helicase